MSSNLLFVRRSRRVFPWSGGLKLEINIPSQRIRAKWKGGLINEGGVISSEYGTFFYSVILVSHTSEMFPGSPCFSVLQATENWRGGGGGGATILLCCCFNLL